MLAELRHSMVSGASLRGVWRYGIPTLLDRSFLCLGHDELLQLHLIAVSELRHVDARAGNSLHLEGVQSDVRVVREWSVRR